MGTKIRPGTQITDFWPDNDENTLYIVAGDGISFSELLEEIKTHFGAESKLEDFNISHDFIHTSCIYYDKIDFEDYTSFLVIKRIKH